LRQNVNDLLKALANQSNAQVEEGRRSSPQPMVRKAVEKNDVQNAMELAGQTSPNTSGATSARPTRSGKEPRRSCSNGSYSLKTYMLVITCS
jgi:hypothetical protein